MWSRPVNGGQEKPLKYEDKNIPEKHYVDNAYFGFAFERQRRGVMST